MFKTALSKNKSLIDQNKHPPNTTVAAEEGEGAGEGVAAWKGVAAQKGVTAGEGVTVGEGVAAGEGVPFRRVYHSQSYPPHSLYTPA